MTDEEALAEIAATAHGLFVEWIDCDDPGGTHQFDAERASTRIAELAEKATGRHVPYAESDADANLFERGQNRTNVTRFFQAEIDAMVEHPSYWIERVGEA